MMTQAIRVVSAVLMTLLHSFLCSVNSREEAPPTHKLTFFYLRPFFISRNHLLNEFAIQTQNTRHKNKGRLNSRYQPVLILAGLHVVDREFSGEFRSVGGRVIHKTSVKEFA